MRARADLTEVPLANLRIRKLDGETCGRLRDRAARREIPKRAAAPTERLGDLCLKVFGPARGADLKLSPRVPHEPMSFAQAQCPRPRR